MAFSLSSSISFRSLYGISCTLSGVRNHCQRVVPPPFGAVFQVHSGVVVDHQELSRPSRAPNSLSYVRSQMAKCLPPLIFLQDKQDTGLISSQFSQEGSGLLWYLVVNALAIKNQ